MRRLRTRPRRGPSAQNRTSLGRARLMRLGEIHNSTYFCKLSNLVYLLTGPWPTPAPPPAAPGRRTNPASRPTPSSPCASATGRASWPARRGCTGGSYCRGRPRRRSSRSSCLRAGGARQDNSSKVNSSPRRAGPSAPRRGNRLGDLLIGL